MKVNGIVLGIKVNGEAQFPAVLAQTFFPNWVEAPEALQAYVNCVSANAHMDWDKARLIVFYFGAPFPAERLTLPSGLSAKLVRLDPDALDDDLAVLRPYARFLAKAHELLLQGAAPERAAGQAWMAYRNEEVFDVMLNGWEGIPFLTETVRAMQNAMREG